MHALLLLWLDGPFILSAPYTARVGSARLIQTLGARNLRFDSWALAERPLAYLPVLGLEDPLYGVLVHAKQRSHSAVIERWLGLDHLLDRLNELRSDSGLVFTGRAALEAQAQCLHAATTRDWYVAIA